MTSTEPKPVSSVKRIFHLMVMASSCFHAVFKDVQTVMSDCLSIDKTISNNKKCYRGTRTCKIADLRFATCLDNCRSISTRHDFRWLWFLHTTHCQFQCLETGNTIVLSVLMYPFRCLITPIFFIITVVVVVFLVFRAVVFIVDSLHESTENSVLIPSKSKILLLLYHFQTDVFQVPVFRRTISCHGLSRSMGNCRRYCIAPKK